MSTVTLRPWQRDAFDAFLASSSPDFLAVATPGAGKTTFALTCARALLAQEPRPLVPPPVVVVAPTSHLKTQWSLAAHRMGVQLDPDWSPSTGLARDVHGLITTYQQLAIGDTAAKIRGLVADGIVILDEIHHAGHERAWGDGVARAFELAARRLSLSGTPFRSDTAQIPFVRYDATGEGDLAHADFTYGYAEALRDGGVVRPLYFPRFDGQMEWSTPAGDIVRASFSDALARDQASLRLRTALSVDGGWLPTVLVQADERLRDIRDDPDDGQPDAGGLVIATDQDHAHGIARILRDRLRTPVDVVVSDDPSASRKIAEFASNDRPWLVAVRMVSEGVDIPRLRVGVFATTTTTELFFRQAIGRFVRWQAGRPSQKAYVYLPDDPRLRAHAFAIAEARRHVLRPPSADDDDADGDDPLGGAALDAQAHPDDLLPEQLSLFSVLSSTATGLSIHGITESGIEHVADTWTITPAARFDDEPDVPEPSFADDPELAVDLPSVPTPAGAVPTGSLSVAERKDDLRTRNADLAKRLVDLTGWTHARVQAEMNRLAGITKVSTATSDQLERRLRYSESWHRRLRGR